MPILCAFLMISGCAAPGSRTPPQVAEQGLPAAPPTAQTGAEPISLSGSGLDPGELFTPRDLKQTADLSGAKSIAVSDGEDVRITAEGVYILSGTAEECTVRVEADKNAKVQLVLDGLSITNSSFPCLYIVSADKVFVTLAADSALRVTDSFREDGEIRTDGVIYSRADLVLNGRAALEIRSSDNGVVGKDELKITGGSYRISAGDCAVEANDSVCIAGGSFMLESGKDAIHAENDDDDSLGYVYIGGGDFTIRAGDDGIHAKSAVRIDGGSFDISAAEGVEGTYVEINGGSFDIQSTDDGINATRKSHAVQTAVVINGGEISIRMGAGDSDGVDSNGVIVINGGTVTISGGNGFDYESGAELNGGTVVVNGEQLSEIPNQFAGGPGGPGGRGGGPGGAPPGGFPGGRR